MKHPQADVTSQAEWNAFYNETDIRFIYDVSKTTVSQSAATAALNSTSNGILFIRHFYKQWGQPSLANSYTALTELDSLKVEKHEDPAPVFKKLDYLFEDYFPDCGENLKCAKVLQILDKGKYKTLLDTLDQQETGADYRKLQENIKQFYSRKRAEHEAFLQQTQKGKVAKTPVKKKKEDEVALAAAASNDEKLTDRGKQSKKRKQFCKTCRRHVRDHTTNYCPLLKGKAPFRQNDKKKDNQPD